MDINKILGLIFDPNSYFYIESYIFSISITIFSTLVFVLVSIVWSRVFARKNGYYDDVS
jgi:hypothetical protein